MFITTLMKLSFCLQIVLALLTEIWKSSLNRQAKKDWNQSYSDQCMEESGKPLFPGLLISYTPRHVEMQVQYLKIKQEYWKV